MTFGSKNNGPIKKQKNDEVDNNSVAKWRMLLKKVSIYNWPIRKDLVAKNNYHSI